MGGAETQDVPPERKGVLKWLTVGLPAPNLLPAVPSRGVVPRPMNMEALWFLHCLQPPQQRTPSAREGGLPPHSEMSLIYKQSKEGR